MKLSKKLSISLFTGAMLFTTLAIVFTNDSYIGDYSALEYDSESEDFATCEIIFSHDIINDFDDSSFETVIFGDSDIEYSNNQILVGHQDIGASGGTWSQYFQTVGASVAGNRLNVLYRNDANNTATVRVQRRNGTSWIDVITFNVSSGSESTRQVSDIFLNTEHRIVINGASHAPVSGYVGAKQTNKVLN